MGKLYGGEGIVVRSLEDKPEDYALLQRWLSTPAVCEYYEGRTRPYDKAMIREKFGHRARGLSSVVVGMVEYGGGPIGFVQFYPAEKGEYREQDVVDTSRYTASYGIDIVIGEPACWNRGVGTSVMKLTVEYLFRRKGADIIFIDPQTWNTRAVRCYEKVGFRRLKIIPEREQHDGQWKDSLLMAMTAHDLQGGQPHNVYN